MKTLLTVAALAAAGFTALSLLPAQAQSSHDHERKAEPEVQTPAQKEMRKCFRSDDIDRFNPVDSRTMIIETYNRQHYKLELSGACMGIEDAFRIGVKTRAGSINICGGFDAEILYSDSGSGRLAKCNITQVTPITQEEADRIEGVAPKEANSSSDRSSREGA
ncbi:DUF6491 family protein [Asticcacaulis sp. AND118]|uniref:DUF6491 family protein n=1 Tax=Asticcacaulis sp. AND118 TaxID=2840468 RepID=UPI001CFFC0BC|nr:DUF6491 family protein [Asticcacaulis sp. AND118]UDF04962.1 DUF6491 family protein [Asticcacaulis sp. AND118]